MIGHENGSHRDHVCIKKHMLAYAYTSICKRLQTTRMLLQSGICPNSDRVIFGCQYRDYGNYSEHIYVTVHGFKGSGVQGFKGCVGLRDVHYQVNNLT